MLLWNRLSANPTYTGYYITLVWLYPATSILTAPRCVRWHGQLLCDWLRWPYFARQPCTLFCIAPIHKLQSIWHLQITFCMALLHLRCCSVVKCRSTFALVNSTLFMPLDLDISVLKLHFFSCERHLLYSSCSIVFPSFPICLILE